MEIKIIVPSKGRANLITTHKHIDNVIICVAESEVEEYKKFHPDLEFSVHPDTVIGMAQKREWMRKEFGSIMMIDDDILGISRLTQKKGERSKLTPDEAYWIIQNVGNLAKLAECYLFGFNVYKTPMSYLGTTPFATSGFINGVSMGILEGADKLKFHPEIKVNNDLYITGLNAYFYRKAFIDNRFSVMQDSFANKIGGNASARTREAELKDLMILKKSFGSAIKQPPKNKIDVKHEFYKKIIVPF